MKTLGHVVFGSVLTLATAAFMPWLVEAESRSLAVAVVAVPIIVVLVLLWRGVERGESVMVGKRFTFLLAGYCALLAMLPGIQSLQWKDQLVGYDDVVPSNWLGLDRFGDWRYRLFPRPRAADDMLIVRVPAQNPQGGPWLRTELRHRFAALINQAVRAGAKGVVLDYYFEVPSESDDLLCAQIKRAQAGNVPVFVGFLHIEDDGQLVRRRLPPTLSTCIPEAHQGYLAGYLEPDHRVRRVPLFFLRDSNRPALSLLAARHLVGEDLEMPPADLLQYLEPHKRIPSVSDFLTGDAIERYRDRLVFVGPSSPHDRVDTPYGPRQGVEIHAAATHALRTGAWVHNAGTLLTLPTIYALCYLLIWLQVRAGGVGALIKHAAWISCGLALLAVVAAKAGIWIELAYPLVAIWLLVLIFLVYGRYFAFKAPPRLARQAATPSTQPDFDVFLCHNSLDKDSVRQLFDALVERGLRPWFDENELPPGHDWQVGIEAGLKASRAVAVIVGPSGAGPWAKQEMRAALILNVDRKTPVIPLLLPGVAHKPDLPLFLQLFTWVDCRKGLTEQAMARLEWGITGRKQAKHQVDGEARNAALNQVAPGARSDERGG